MQCGEFCRSYGACENQETKLSSASPWAIVVLSLRDGARGDRDINCLWSDESRSLASSGVEILDPYGINSDLVLPRQPYIIRAIFCARGPNCISVAL
jgi:hypothetical protein